MTVVGSPTELLVAWDPPAERNGIILSYTIYYYNQPMENDPDVPVTSQLDYEQVRTNETAAVLVNLTPYSYYGCLITANTSVGEGNSSLLRFNITDESGKCHSYTDLDVCIPTIMRFCM